MNKRPLAVQLLATLLCLALPSASMAQIRGAEPAAPAAVAGAAAPVPALTAPQLQAALEGGAPVDVDQWSRVVVPAVPDAAAEGAQLGWGDAGSASAPAARALQVSRGAAPRGRTARAFRRLQGLLHDAEHMFSPHSAGGDEAAVPAPQPAPAPSEESVVDPRAPTAKLVLRLHELAETEPDAALEQAQRLLASDKRLEVRLAAVRVAGQVGGARGAALLTKNLASDGSLYVRRETAKQLGRGAAGLQDGRAEAISALRDVLRETARPQVEPGMRDSVFHMAAWAFEQFGESAEPFKADRAKAISAQQDWKRAQSEPAQPSATQPPEPPQTTGLLSFFRGARIKWMGMALAGLLLGSELLVLNKVSQPDPSAKTPAAVTQAAPAPQAPALPGGVQLKTAPAPAKPAEAAKPTAEQSLADIAAQLKAQNDRAEREALEKKMAQQNAMPAWLSSILSLLVMVAIMIGLSRFLQGQQMKGAAKMGNFNFEKETPKVRFDDVAGADDARQEVSEIVDFLKNPKKYKRLGGRLPKGALLVGPPGTGKTLLAKAVAGETGANFYTVSGSDFVEMFVGVGASRVRQLFEKARENAPAVIFIDEIDAIGRKRSSGGPGGGNDEREQTLNQLLVAMDGFDNSSGVVVLAATNREDVLDPALLRPGRFDRKVHVGLPDVLGREAILQVHAKSVPLAHDADLELTAKRTAGLSGAFLQGVVNEGALEAARRDGDAVNAADLDKGIAKNTIGAERPNMFVPAPTKLRIAQHEIGHVLVSWFTTGKVPYKVTAIPHGAGALGYAESAQEDEFLHTEPMLKNRLAILMGGRAAEKRIYGNYSSGADNDLEVATRIARAMVQRFGMGKATGFAQTSPDPNSFARNVSEETLRENDLEVRRLLEEAEATANRILDEHWATHELLSKRLVGNETMFGEEIERLAGPRKK